jgi:hypothetical protein
MTEAEWLDCTEPFAAYDFLRGETITHKTRWQGWVTVSRFPVSERKLRLFACGCCARIAHLLPVDEARDLLKAAEDFADGSIGEMDLDLAERRCEEAIRAKGRSDSSWLGFEREALTAVRLVPRTEAGGRPGSLPAAAQAWTGAIVWQRYVDSLGGKLRLKPGEFAPLEAAVRTCDRPFLAEELAGEAARQAHILRDVIGNPFQSSTPDPAWLAWKNGTIVRMAQAIYRDRLFGDLPVLGDALEEAGCSDDHFLSHCRSGGPHVRGCWVIDRLSGRR